MNKNIEVINCKLWAVNFSLIPYIEEVSYTPDPNYKPYTEIGRMLDNQGVILLNKDHAGYQLSKKFLLEAMGYSNIRLKRIAKRQQIKKSKNPIDLLAHATYRVELERREKSKLLKGR